MIKWIMIICFTINISYGISLNPLKVGTEEIKIEKQPLVETNNNENIIDLENLTILKKEKLESSEDDFLKEKQYLSNILDSLVKEKYSNQISADILKEIETLELKIQINEKSNYKKAVIRDEAKFYFYKNQIYFNNLLDDLINLRKSYANKNDFIEVLNNFNKQVNTEYYKSLMLSKDEIINKTELSQIDNDFIENIKELENEVSALNLIKDYIYDNLNKVIKKSLILEKLNIDNYISKIDNMPFAKEINYILIYNLKTSLGKILLALLSFTLIIGFRFLFLNIIVKVLQMSSTNNNVTLLKKYLSKTIKRPLELSLLVLAFEIFLKIIYNSQFNLLLFLSITKSFYSISFIWLIKNAFSNYLTIYSEKILIQYPNVRKEILLFMQRLFNILLFAILLSIILSNLGYDITVIIGGLGVFGIGVSLAAKETFSHFIGSINLLLDKPFEPNDWILSGDIEGTVVEIGMRGTRIRTFDNAMVSVPNSILASSPIINYSKRVLGRRIKLDLNVTYESDHNDFKNLITDIKDMLINHPEIANNETEMDSKTRQQRTFLLNKENDIGIKKTLLVSFDSYGESSKNILIYCFSKTVDWENWLDVKADVLFKIEELMVKNRCEFAYPTQRKFEQIQYIGNESDNIEQIK